MDKITITSLGQVPEVAPIYIQIGEATIEVKKRVSYTEVLNLIQWSVNLIVDDRPFAAAPLEQIIEDFAFIKFFTNLDLSIFDAEQFDIQEAYTIYDTISFFDGFAKVKNMIDAQQKDFITTNLQKTIDSIIAYRNSAAGIIDKLADNAKTNTEVMSEAISMLQDPAKIEEVEKLLAIADKVKASN